MKKILSLFLSFLLLLSIAGCKDGQQTNPSGTQPKDDSVPNENHAAFYDYSETRNPDNITFTLRKPKTDNIIYALNISQEGIGKDLKIGNAVIENDAFQITSYEDEVNGILFLNNIGKYDLAFYLFPLWTNETFDPDREKVKENDKQLLVHEYLYGENYTVYLKTDDMFIRISADISDENSANEFFDYVNENIHVATINYETVENKYIKLDFASATQGDNPIDVSNWTFATDLIADSCRKDGLNIRASSDIRGFNVDKSSTLDLYCKHNENNRSSSLRYHFSPVAEGTFDKENAVVEVNAGASVWKLTEIEQTTSQAVVKTGTGKEYTVSTEYRSYKTEVTQDMMKSDIMELFQ